MGSHDEQLRRRPPMIGPRRWAWRAVLSVLAGSGLTAAGLSGPFVGGALADVPAGSTSPAEGSTAPVTTSTPETPAATQPTTTSTTSSPSATPQPSTPAPAVAEAPTVVVQRRQKTTAGKNERRNLTATRPQPHGGGQTKSGTGAERGATPSGPNNVAPSPQLVAAQAGAFAAELASSAASMQALDFYRIPLFLLPIYRAAAIQYGVPWQILAAINEVETNYGSDLAVSSAGAEGWMQFEPATWLRYGVDALAAGYADPYNPVDAIFAAARYLHAAGASTNLRTAILA
ncbi:MAG TPA: lytic transglycosylase domain-containing protein, partial [Caulobacteraceae bacterium]